MTARRTLLALATSALLCTAAAPEKTSSFDQPAWKADYERLKVALAQGYANLDWQVERRGLDLVRADGFIRAMLDRADSDAGATLVFAKLIDAFKDPHLELAAGPPPEGATLVPVASAVGGPAVLPSSCEAAGYENGRAATRLPYPRAPGWTELSAAPFQAGMIGTAGIIRIPAFGEDRYLDVCKAVARDGLAGRDLQLATRAELNRRLKALIQQMKARGMTRLVIDVTRNGGGSEWDAEVATLFAAGKLSRMEPRQVGPACDRTGMWKGQAPACSAYKGAPSTEWIMNDGPPAWTGPLAILADDRTASAAEEFITWLRDNGKAVMAGKRTAGAGCGYMDGGNSFAFRAASIHLMIPNCSRFTRDGTNEIEGQAPDLAVDWAALPATDVPDTLDRLFAISGR